MLPISVFRSLLPPPLLSPISLHLSFRFPPVVSLLSSLFACPCLHYSGFAVVGSVLMGSRPSPLHEDRSLGQPLASQSRTSWLERRRRSRPNSDSSLKGKLEFKEDPKLEPHAPGALHATAVLGAQVGAALVSWRLSVAWLQTLGWHHPVPFGLLVALGVQVCVAPDRVSPYRVLYSC